MRLHRFYINQEIGKETRIENAELLNQWIKVFRLKTSDRVIVFNGNGKEYEGYFKVLSKKEAVLIIDKESENPRSSASIPHKSASMKLEIFQSIIKKDNFELIVQKCTELGASAFHPIVSERSEKKDLNIERLKKITVEASEQSGRGDIPEVSVPTSIEEAIESFDGEIMVLDFDGEPLSSLRAERPPATLCVALRAGSKPGLDCHGSTLAMTDKKLGLLIGPEGGWTEKEREYFKEKGIKSFSLGTPILRAETASIAISSLLLLG